MIISIAASLCNAQRITNYMGPGDGVEVIPINFMTVIPSPVRVSSSVNAEFAVSMAGASLVHYDGDSYLQIGWVWAPNNVFQTEYIPLQVLNAGDFYNAIDDTPFSRGEIIFKLGW